MLIQLFKPELICSHTVNTYKRPVKMNTHLRVILWEIIHQLLHCFLSWAISHRPISHRVTQVADHWAYIMSNQHTERNRQTYFLHLKHTLTHRSNWKYQYYNVQVGLWILWANTMCMSKSSRKLQSSLPLQIPCTALLTKTQCMLGNGSTTWLLTCSHAKKRK